jgi:hypothetical protein
MTDRRVLHVPERVGRVQEIFETVLELEAERRDAFLLEACAGDQRLREEV